MTQPKKLSAADAVNLGLLQEINRQFLHPRGFAADVDPFGVLTIWDMTADPEGVVFPEDQPAHPDIAAELAALFIRNAQTRTAVFGWVVQPFPAP